MKFLNCKEYLFLPPNEPNLDLKIIRNRCICFEIQNNARSRNILHGFRELSACISCDFGDMTSIDLKPSSFFWASDKYICRLYLSEKSTKEYIHRTKFGELCLFSLFLTLEIDRSELSKELSPKICTKEFVSNFIPDMNTFFMFCCDLL